MSDRSERHFPVFIDLNQRLVLIVGGGKRAEKAVRRVSRYGANVVVVTEQSTPGLVRAEADGLAIVERRAYRSSDADHAVLVMCVTDDDALRRQVFADAEARGCLVNTAGDPLRSTFTVPSVVNRGKLQVAVSTAGAAPAVAKRLRKRLEDELTESWGTWVALQGEVRAIAGERIEDADERERLIESAADPAVLERIEAGEELDAVSLLDELAAALAANEDTRPQEEQ